MRNLEWSGKRRPVCRLDMFAAQIIALYFACFVIKNLDSNSIKRNNFLVLPFEHSEIRHFETKKKLRHRSTEMMRRSFNRHSTSAAAAPPVVYDAVVVGAGLSGLYAAATLKSHGVTNIRVLEASNRPGGRVLTAEDDNTLELGAAFYGPGQNRMLALIEKLKLQTVSSTPTTNASPDAMLLTAVPSSRRTNPFSFFAFRKNKDADVGMSGARMGSLVAFRWNGIKSHLPNHTFFVRIDMNNAMRKIETLQATVNVHSPEQTPDAKLLDSVRVPEFLNNICWSKPVYHFLYSQFRVLLTTDPENVSVLTMLWFVKCAGGFGALMEGETWKLKGGNSQVVQQLLSREVGEENVSFNSALREVALITEEGDESQIVKLSVRKPQQHEEGKEAGSSEIILARHLIFAIPPTQIARVHFDASVQMRTARRLQLETFSMGQVIKTFCYFQKPFWFKNKSGLSGRLLCSSGVNSALEFEATRSGQLSSCGLASTSMPAADVYDVSDGSEGKTAACLLGFVEAGDGERWVSKTPEQRRDALVQQYCTIFNDAQPLPQDSALVKYREKVWADEAFIGGGFFALGRAGSLSSFGREWCRPMAGGRILFAGTEAADCWSGYMEGAVEAGERAANCVLHKMGKMVASETAAATTMAQDCAAATVESNPLYDKMTNVPIPAGRPAATGSCVSRRLPNPDAMFQFVCGFTIMMCLPSIYNYFFD